MEPDKDIRHCLLFCFHQKCCWCI